MFEIIELTPVCSSAHLISVNVRVCATSHPIQLLTSTGIATSAHHVTMYLELLFAVLLVSLYHERIMKTLRKFTVFY